MCERYRVSVVFPKRSGYGYSEYHTDGREDARRQASLYREMHPGGDIEIDDLDTEETIV